MQTTALRTPPAAYRRDHACPAAAATRRLSGFHHPRSNTAAATSGHSDSSLQRRLGLPRLAVTASAGTGEGSASGCAIKRNILVAVDSSKDSQHALQWTVQEVYRPGDVIHVSHCIPYLAVPGGIYAVQGEADGRVGMVNVDALLAHDEQYLMAEQRELQRMCEQVFGGQQVSHVVDVLREDPTGRGDKGRIADALCKQAEELQAAAVVIASHQKSGLSEFLLGSVAAHCTTHCTRPVLVLNAPQLAQHGGPGLLDRLASAAATALGGGQQTQQAQQAQQQRDAMAAGTEAGGGRVATARESGGGGSGEEAGWGAACTLRRDIVLAVDDSDASEKACAWALANLHRQGDTFHLLRIIPTLPYRATYGGLVLDGMVFYMEPPTEDFKTAAHRYVQHRFEPKLKEAGIAYEVDIVVEDVDESVAGVGKAICAKSEDLGAAAVVIGSHMSGGLAQFMLGSVANYVAHNCTRPVAVLH